MTLRSKKRECSTANFLFSNVEPWMLYSAQYQGEIWSAVYLVIRALATLYFFAWFILALRFPGSWDGLPVGARNKWPIYLTNQAYLAFVISMFWNLGVAVYCYAKPRDKPLDSLTWYLKLNWILYLFSIPCALNVTLIFWVVLYSPGDVLAPAAYTTHGVNILYIILLDMWISAIPIRLLQFWVPLMLGVFFTIFSVVYDLVGGTNVYEQPYIYSVLDYNSSEGSTEAIIYVFVGVAGILICHGFLFGLYRLKMFLVGQCGKTRVQPLENVNMDTERKPTLVELST